jgi:hypothetical protein
MPAISTVGAPNAYRPKNPSIRLSSRQSTSSTCCPARALSTCHSSFSRPPSAATTRVSNPASSRKSRGDRPQASSIMHRSKYPPISQPAAIPPPPSPQGLVSHRAAQSGRYPPEPAARASQLGNAQRTAWRRPLSRDWRRVGPAPLLGAARSFVRKTGVGGGDGRGLVGLEGASLRRSSGARAASSGGALMGERSDKPMAKRRPQLRDRVRF